MIALGLAGPAVGDMLDALLGAVIDGFVPNERNALLFWARDRMEERL